MGKPVGVTIDWYGNICLCFEGGFILYNSVESIHDLSKRTDRILYPEYFKEDEEWPVDPVTRQKLPIWVGDKKPISRFKRKVLKFIARIKRIIKFNKRRVV